MNRTRRQNFYWFKRLKNREPLQEKSQQKIFAELPSVDFLLNTPECAEFLETFSRNFIKGILQEEIQSLRLQLKSAGSAVDSSRDALVMRILQQTRASLNRRLSSKLRYVINASGIVLHTNLGRARLAEAARQNLMAVSRGFCNLEIDLESGKRGRRNDLVEGCICDLTGAEAACVVNNNAAAVLIALNSLALGKEAIISRGQLIEIGGAFRLPEVMEKSGVRMVEVGTTNKTRIQDYENALSRKTGVLVIAHSSNYRILGFTEEATLAEVVALGQKHQIPVLHDLGGGVLVDLRKYGLPYEPLVQDSLVAGVDVVTFSGDKVLGGPQSGLIVGKKSVLTKIEKNPLMRALRCDKLIYAALEATLQLFVQEQRLSQEHPTLHMLTEPVAEVKSRTEKLLALLPQIPNIQFALCECTSQTGSGALPLEQIPSWGLVITSDRFSAETIARLLRQNEPPIIPYIKNNRVYLDLRTVAASELEQIKNAFDQIVLHSLTGLN